MKGLGLYIHIPFCRAKCHYCDFASYTGKTEFYKAYTSALIQEMQRCDALANGGIETIFIGGGTPTVLPVDMLAEIFETINHYTIVTPGAEITMEANPGTLTPTLLKDLKAFGVNRLSLGVQAWQDHLLHALGRIHTAAQCQESIALAQDAGFENINCDLMFALPGQTELDWMETLEKAVAVSPTHLSVYGLTVEEDTPFGRLLEAGQLPLPPQETDRAMYHEAQRFLKEKGFEQYEISNWAKPGKAKCAHNMKYWRREPVLGFGLGAHSFDGVRRWGNTTDLQTYIQCGGCPPRTEDTVITPEAAMSEFMFLGLRLADGVDMHGFKAEFNQDMQAVFGHAIEKHLQNGLLKLEGSRLTLTNKGLDVSNMVFCDFL